MKLGHDLAGVPGGSQHPSHWRASYPGTPASSIVGMSGAPTVRLSLVTPSARSLPPLM